MSGNFDYKIATHGQSNMVGWDFVTSVDQGSISTWKASGTAWNLYTESSVSLVNNLSKKLQELNPVVRLGFVRSAVAGKGVVDTWAVPASATYIAGEDDINDIGGVQSVLFFGGETDIINGISQANLVSGFETYMSNLRNGTSTPSLTFYVIKPYAGAESQAANDAVRNGFDQLESEGKIVIIADAFDYQYDLIDDIHLSGATLNTMGDDIGITISPLLNLTPTYTEPTITIGTTGDFLNYVTAYSAMPSTFISNIRVLAISDHTGGLVTLSKTHGIYDLIFDGGGFLYDSTSTSQVVVFNPISSGNVVFENHNLLRTGVVTNAVMGMLWIAGASFTGKYIIRNNILDNNSTLGYAVTVHDTTPVLEVFNNIFRNIDGGTLPAILLNLSDGNPNSVYGNNTFIDCYAGINFSTNPGKAQNNTFLGTFIYTEANTSQLSVYTPGVEVLDAEILNAVQSITNSDPNYLWPVKDGVLYGTGTKTVIEGHTKYLNGVSIDFGNLNFDVGANGLPRVSGGGSGAGNKSITSISIGIGLGQIY